MDFLDDVLFDKHCLVCRTENGEGEKQFETMFSLANLFGIKIVKGIELLCPDMIPVAEIKLGKDVPEPFYKGFPQSVRELSHDALLFDQLLHYVRTYGLNDFSEPGHSLFEKDFNRTAFKEENRILEFSVVTIEEAIEVYKGAAKDLLAGTRPLSNYDYNNVISSVREGWFDISEFGNIASKDTCVRLMIDLRDTENILDLSGPLVLSDVIRLVGMLNYRDYNNTDIRKLNLKNRDRKFISALIDRLIADGKCDLKTCYEKKSKWSGLLHHLHYIPKSDEGRDFVNAMRSSGNESVYSYFEKAMAEKDIPKAVDILSRGKGTSMILRSLDYLLSRSDTPEDINCIMENIRSKNLILLLQLLFNYSVYRENKTGRTFKFTRFNKLVTHVATPREISRRRTGVSKVQNRMIFDRILSIIKDTLKNRLGKVYIDPDMKNYALPIQENTSQGGFGVLPKGSRIRIPEGRKLRAFTYWELVDDIDLSCFGFANDGTRLEFSWRTMSDNQSEAITFSGDQTSGYKGGSEYFDIDLDRLAGLYPDLHYMIFCNNVFSDVPFKDVICRAGYMMRDTEDSGRIFEPKTVESSFAINCNSISAYLFGIDFTTRDFVWLNIAQNRMARVAGTTEMDFLLPYFNITETLNVRNFFEMMATELTDDISEAEYIVTDKTVEAPGDAVVIREYDFEKIIALMNMQ